VKKKIVATSRPIVLAAEIRLVISAHPPTHISHLPMVTKLRPEIYLTMKWNINMASSTTKNMLWCSGGK
jgi:hypothetical protein